MQLPDKHDEFTHFVYGLEATVTACGIDWYITLTATTAQDKVTCPRCQRAIKPVSRQADKQAA